MSDVIDIGTYTRFLLVLIFVIGLILALSWAARRFGLTGMVPQARGRRAERRLGVVEMASLDARRRLVLIKRDGVEHLLLLGGHTDMVIERGIAGADFATALAATAPGEPTDDDPTEETHS